MERQLNYIIRLMEKFPVFSEIWEEIEKTSHI